MKISRKDFLKAILAVVISAALIGCGSEDEFIMKQAGYEIKTKSVAARDIIIPMDKPFGRLVCDNVGIDVELYYSASQEIVDNVEYAAVIPTTPIIGTTGAALIADHNTQAFSALPDVEIGDVMYVTTYYGEFVYRVVKIGIGTLDETDTDIILDDGFDVLDFCETNQGKGLVLYTCYNDTNNAEDVDETDDDAVNAQNLYGDEEVNNRRIVIILEMIGGTEIML